MTPVFAVVGHPNKGKSSIVATLAQDDSVAISAQSGTTRVAEVFPIKVGTSEFRLIDTPGFQRPARVLQWLQANASSADQRQAAVRSFVADATCQQSFPDEVQLLKPIVDGAAILYVVDGSRPYGAEYEAEMEILRWTGQPSMALINPIENESHIDSWRQALSQYFKVVKLFNPMQADFEKRLAILETFSLLKDDWRESILQLIGAYKDVGAKQRNQSLQVLADLLSDVCSYQVSQKTLSKAQATALRASLEKIFLTNLKASEARAHEALKRVYQYHNLHSELYELSFADDLFDTEKWVIWGLNRSQLTAAATMAGAAAGAAIDVSLLGGSLMMGALGGGLLAGGGAWLGADRIANFKIKGLPLGGYEARQGPVKNRNFPYVILSRYLFLEQALRNRTHAQRDRIKIEEGDLAGLLERLNSSQLRQLHSSLDKLRRQRSVDDLQQVLRPLFESLL